MIPIIAPWWVPKFALKAALGVWALGVGFLSKVGLHAPYILNFDYGPNSSVVGYGLPIDDYLEIVEAREIHTTAGTDGGAVTAIIEKLTGTQAPGGGANMLQTQTFNLKGTPNTMQTIKRSQLTALTAAQQAATQTKPGDRVAFTTTGTLTTLAGVGVTVVLRRIRIGASFAR